MNVYALDFSQEAVNPIAKVSTIGSLVNVIIPIIMIVVALAFLAMLVMGAFTYLTSGGVPEKTKKAQSTLTSAIIGLFIVVFAYLIVRLLGYIFNIEMPI